METYFTEKLTGKPPDPLAGWTRNYYLALYQMRDDCEHHAEDTPLGTVTSITLPATDDEIDARTQQMAHSLADWLKANRARWDATVIA